MFFKTSKKPKPAPATDSAMHEVPGCVIPEAPARRIRRQPISPKELVHGILHGDRIVLARAITLIESARHDDRALAEEIIEACLPHAGDSIRVGITGVPGAGKSSLIEALGHMLTERRQKLAVLAVDPSSTLSGGSILGDKTRMTELSRSDLAFIRPSPSRGTLGGVAQRTREVMILCEAAGFRNVLIETVGVGQSETAVRNMVDFFLLVAISGAGDELQGIKRGVMEIADLVAVNKADGDNLQPAEFARSQITNALHFFPASPSGWIPKAQTCSASTGAGVAELWETILEHSKHTRANGWRDFVRREQMRTAMRSAIEEELRNRFESTPGIPERMKELDHSVVTGKITPFAAARELLNLYSLKK